jgi:predicted ATPase
VTGFLRWIELDHDCPEAGYPYVPPVVAALRAAGRLRLDPAVTFLTGDTGTGKSTLIEAIAVAAGFNPEGGSHRSLSHRSAAHRASRSTSSTEPRKTDRMVCTYQSVCFTLAV